MQTVHTVGSTGDPPAGTAVLDQLRVEWSEIATVMSNGPAEEITVKEETPAEDLPEFADMTSAIKATEAGQDRPILSRTYNITSERLDHRYKHIPHDPFQLTLFIEEETDI